MEEKKIRIKKMDRGVENNAKDGYVVSEVESESVMASSNESEEFISNLKRKNPFFKSFFFIILLVVVLGIIAYFVFGNNSSSTNNSANTSTSTVSAEGARVLAQLSKIMVLPEGTNPVIASVTNANVLKSQQAFFADVKNGDWVIIYPGLAIIFDAKANIITKVGPVQISNVSDNMGSTSTKSTKAGTK